MHGRTLTPMVDRSARPDRRPRARTESRARAESRPPTRQERKEQTRQAMLDATLRLLADRGLASLSLREVCREVGIVPTAFYRHFASMDELGVALVEDSMRTLRQSLRAIRRDAAADPIKGSVAALAAEVREHEPQFRFLTRERFGGPVAVRQAIATELRLISAELSTDLARLPITREWRIEDLHMTADLMVGAMLYTVLALLEVDQRRRDDEDELVRTAERQLRLIALGMTQWRSAV